MRRYLFGPVSAAFADQNLLGPRQTGACLAFDPAGTTDLAIGPADTWETVWAHLPSGWRPDFIALSLADTAIPACLWSAAVPLVGLAADWNLHWHHYRRCLPGCDLILTGTAGVATLVREGILQARAANLCGCERSFLEATWPDGARDIDILFVGDPHPAVQRECLPWLARLARLGERWRVALHTGVSGDAYRDLLGRARIVFNQSFHGECNRWAFAAAASGALLFQEAENREVPGYFHDRQECIYYTGDNLEGLLEHYLEHEDERRSLAEAAHNRVRHCSFENLWEELLSLIDQEWSGMTERARHRPSQGLVDDLLARVWQMLSSSDVADETLVPDLAAAVVAQPHAAALHNALGLAVTRAAQGHGPVTRPVVEKGVGYFQRALANDPTYVVAGLNLAEALVLVEQTQLAIDAARRTLASLERLPQLAPTLLDAGYFLPGFDFFRVEWERAAWSHAGQTAAEVRAKRDLLRWRLHTLLADLTGDFAHSYEAVVARPDLPVTRSALGGTLVHARRPAEAIAHLRQAVAENPLDRAGACALFDALGEVGDAAGQRCLARDRRLLAQAAPQVVPAEPWFVEAPPVGDELASLIILCCNQLHYTRLCLEGVLRHTRSPYELILVDNGSSDDTHTYLEQVRSRPGPARVEVIRNETNRGFPAGCNQGLGRARGRYLVLLNNDIVVTAGWLEGLIGWALHDWPNVGLVGAVTNYAAPPQQIPVNYTDLDGLDAFAAQRRRDYAGRALQVERLTGFCLLIRREVLDRIGDFDEQFGLGFFDDDDLCVRAREAAFRLLVAFNVFVHHFGSRTFAGLGIDCQQQLRSNFEQFRAKWGPERAAGYHLPENLCVGRSAVGSQDADITLSPRGVVPEQTDSSVSSLPTAHCPLPTARGVSLCLIVKNEEANLPACLDSAADLVGEIIVVDTGSTDRTKEVAAGLGARVFDFAWVDSFAAARNESLRHATRPWIFWLDADDRLDGENRQRLQALFADLRDENVAYVMKCLCLPDADTGTATVVDHVRLFCNHPDLRWQYRVHEQILPAVRRSGGTLRWSDVVIHHVGYQDPLLRGRKLERDLRLLQLEHAEQPGDPFTLFNLGSIYRELQRPAEALPLLRQSLERSQPADSIVRKLYALIVQCHRQLGQGTEALTACREGRGCYPEDAELLFLEGLALHEQGDRAGAEARLLRLLGTQEGAHFASVDAGLRGYKARHNLAVIYQEQGRAAEAEAQWRTALGEQPDFAPAWLGLGELCLERGRWAELEQMVERLEADPHSGVEAAVLRARGQLARKEFAAARQLLDRAIARSPQALWPRVILSHVLLQEGRDYVAAEKALQEVLALDPGNTQARSNLRVLLHKQGRVEAEERATEMRGPFASARAELGADDYR